MYIYIYTYTVHVVLKKMWIKMDILMQLSHIEMSFKLIGNSSVTFCKSKLQFPPVELRGSCTETRSRPKIKRSSALLSRDEGLSKGLDIHTEIYVCFYVYIYI